NGADKAVSETRKGFNVAGRFGRVAECRAQTVGGSVQSIFEINKSASRPELFAEVLSSNQLARFCEQRLQNLYGFGLYLYTYAVLGQLPSLAPKLEATKPEDTSRSRIRDMGRFRHATS